MHEFWHLMSHDPIIMREFNELGRIDSLRGIKFSQAALGLKIGFWDKNVNRPMPPYVARIIVADGKISYYLANTKDQSLQEPIVETIEQATTIYNSTLSQS